MWLTEWLTFKWNHVNREKKRRKIKQRKRLQSRMKVVKYGFTQKNPKRILEEDKSKEEKNKKTE